jgi:Tfp pilus tip-associated adhesin PilY1
MHGSIIESRPLVAGANLTRVFITAMLAWMEGGWTISEFSSTSATFFCSRSTEQRMVSIDPTDPYDLPLYGGSHLSGRGNEYD